MLRNHLPKALIQRERFTEFRSRLSHQRNSPFKFLVGSETIAQQKWLCFRNLIGHGEAEALNLGSAMQRQKRGSADPDSLLLENFHPISITTTTKSMNFDSSNITATRNHGDVALWVEYF
jgi:hypothetical protein